MRQLLAQASVVAEGPAQNLEAEPTSHSQSSGNEPRSQGVALYDRMVVRFSGASTDLEIRRAVSWATYELTRALRRPRAEMNAEQEQYWKLQSVQGSGGMDYRKAAERAGLSEKRVWAIRKKNGLDPRNGLPKAA